jgi:hypothetical protein
VAVDAHEPGGASLDANAAPAPTEGTASVKLIGVAEKAAAAEPEALELRAESTAWRRLETLLPPLPRNGLGEPGHHCEEPRTCAAGSIEAPLRSLQGRSPSEGKHGPNRHRETSCERVCWLHKTARRLS